MSAYRVVRASDPDFRMADDRQIVEGGAWAPFVLESPVGNEYFPRLQRDFPDYQFLLYDGDTPVAAGNTIPLVWDLDEATLNERGWEWALETGFDGLKRDIPPTTLCALSMTVARDYLGKGVSSEGLRTMRTIAEQHGLNALIAPVRPTLKASYPLTPMERYITWTRADGTPFDPWLRTHWRLGARIVKVAARSMVIPGTVAQWEDWAGMKFPESGDYVVPGALNPVTADIEHDCITYVEPNVWMLHSANAYPVDGHSANAASKDAYQP